MDVHLIGGGWDDALAPALYGDFIASAARRAGATPRILLVVMGTDAESLDYHAKYVHTLGLVGGHELVVHRVPEGSPLAPSALDAVDGLFVGGGPRRSTTRRSRAPTPTSAPASPRVCRMPGSPREPRSPAPTRSSAAGASTVSRSARRTATRTSTPWPWWRASASCRGPSTCTPPSGATSRARSPSSPPGWRRVRWRSTKARDSGRAVGSSGAGKVWHVTPDTSSPAAASVRAEPAGQ